MPTDLLNYPLHLKINSLSLQPCLMLKPVVKPLNIDFLQVNIIPSGVATTVVLNKNFPARIFASYNNILPNDRHMHILVRLGNMVIRSMFSNHRVFNSEMYM